MARQDLATALFEKAKRYIPGGVNSPVRSFKSVGGCPISVKRGSGSRIYSEGGKGYIDYCLSWGALILGHAYPEVARALGETIKSGTSFGTITRSETELAKIIVDAVPSIERVRLTSSGTEAVMGAVRLARAYTKKNGIIKFEGGYHGHADYLLVKAGSGASTLGMPDSLGVPNDFTRHTIVLPYNDIGRLEKTAKRYQTDLAAIIVEPVQANCGVILPGSGFLQGLRKVADKYGIVLIFDEVITGFRLSYGGAQRWFRVKPDLTCLGKIIGGGLPVGAFGGKKRIMDLLAPEGGVYQAGTLSGNPVAVTAGITTLNILKRRDPYAAMAKKTEDLAGKIKAHAKQHHIRLKVNHIGSMFSVFFSEIDVTDYKTATMQNVGLFRKFFRGLLAEGIYLSPSGFETNFLSTVHTHSDINDTIFAVNRALTGLRES